MKVKVYQINNDHYVVVVPPDYCNSARNISAIGKAIGRTTPATWEIVYEDKGTEVEI